MPQKGSLVASTAPSSGAQLPPPPPASSRQKRCAFLRRVLRKETPPRGCAEQPVLSSGAAGEHRVGSGRRRSPRADISVLQPGRPPHARSAHPPHKRAAAASAVPGSPPTARLCGAAGATDGSRASRTGPVKGRCGALSTRRWARARAS